MQIQGALEAYVLQLEADGRSQHTIAQYRRHVRMFGDWLGPREIENIEPQDLARFLSSSRVREKHAGGPRKATSANAIRTSLRCIFAYVAGAGLIARDPARLVRRARCSPPQPRSLSVDEEARLLAVLRGETERDRMLFTLMLRCGLRLGSAVGLDVEDVDLERGELVIRAKGDRTEIVFVPRSIREELGRLLADGTSGALFMNQLGQRVSTRHARRVFSRALERSGIDRVSGTCRATLQDRAKATRSVTSRAA